MNQLKMYRVFKVYDLLQERPRTIPTICRYLNVKNIIINENILIRTKK